MKNIITALLILMTFGAFAQNSNIESAAIYLRNGEIEDAKKSIDAAVEHVDSKSNPKAWFYFVAVYDTIYRNPAYASLVPPDMVDKFFNGCKKCIELDVKEKYTSYCKENAMINAAFMAYNKGYTYFEAKDFKNAIKSYQMVLDAIPYDKNGDLKKNNLSEKQVCYYMAIAAIQANDKQSAKTYLKKLMDLNYEDHMIYFQMVSTYLEEGDTATALKYEDLGRQKFPSEKDLINQELNIYLSQGKQDILLDKLNAALEARPDDQQLVYVRGNVYDNYASDAFKKYKHDRDTISTLRNKSNTEKNPAKKQVLMSAISSFQKSEAKNLENNKVYVARAEADYLKAIEMNPDFIDAYFNMGAMTNNKTTEVVEKINSLPNNITQAEYDRRAKPLKDRQDSILRVSLGYFQKALEIAEAKADDTPEKKKEKNAYLRDILYSMQQVYANLGDEKKTMDTKKRRESLDK